MKDFITAEERMRLTTEYSFENEKILLGLLFFMVWIFFFTEFKRLGAC